MAFWSSTAQQESLAFDPAFLPQQPFLRSRQYRLTEHFPWKKSLHLTCTPVLVAAPALLERLGTPLQPPQQFPKTPTRGEDLSLFAGIRRLVALYRGLGLEPLVLAGHGQEFAQCNPYTKDFAWQLCCEGVRFCSANPQESLWRLLKKLTASPILLHPVSYPFLRRSGLVLFLNGCADKTRHKDAPLACRPSPATGAGWPLFLNQPLLHLLASEAPFRGDLEHRLLAQAQGPALSTLAVQDTPGRELSACCIFLDAADDLCSVHLTDPLTFAQAEQAGSRLTPEEAQRLLRSVHVPERGIAHATAVGHVARALAQRARLRGKQLDPELACAAGYVHDIAKGFHRHELIGSMWLNYLGLNQLAHCMKDHRDLVLADAKPVTERELVYLADKYCYGPRHVPLEQRFGQKMALFATNPHAVAGIQKRLRHARELEARLTRELGESPERIALTALK